jgi:hypothetical protein
MCCPELDLRRIDDGRRLYRTGSDAHEFDHKPGPAIGVAAIYRAHWLVRVALPMEAGTVMAASF